jgi:hypothetical protein
MKRLWKFYLSNSHCVYLAVAFFCMPSLANTYVTSATLEYCADDHVSFYLNGARILEQSERGYADYQILSTADGTLPLESFKENEENIFCADNLNADGPMSLSYRLNVYHSDGDPVVIWSDPAQSRFVHLYKGAPYPAGWTDAGFDDSQWGQAVAFKEPSNWIALFHLPEHAFDDFFGSGFVPYLAHNDGGGAGADEHNLFRSKFRFPNHPSKVNAIINPTHIKSGGLISVRLIPGPDTTELSRFYILAWLPADLQLTNYAPGASYDSRTRRISWKTSNLEMKVAYLKLYAESIASAGGWASPQKFLGPPKEGKAREKLKIPDSIFEDGAIPNQGAAGWFKLQEPKLDFSQGTPVIQGVIFHSQLKLGGQSANHKPEADRIFFNYSVDGRNQGILKEDVLISRMTGKEYWFDGYYHATQDRRWTWEDIKHLKVMYRALQVGQRDKNFAASVTCVVRYYYPDRVAPWFQARVLEKGCAPVELKTGIFRYGAKFNPADPLRLAVNEGLCIPTPVPMPTATQVVIADARPQPTSTPLPPSSPQIALGLDCLSVSPDPMDYGGAFISFCLKMGARISVALYTDSGKGVRRIAASEFPVGQLNQIFFNGMDDEGKLLAPGRYLCELRAEKDGHAEIRNTYFAVVRKRLRRQ